MRFHKSDKVILWLALLYSIPFLLNADLFKDDLYRAVSGDPSYWDKDSRPLTTILMKVFNLGQMITDLSPLSFIVAMSCMVISAMIISRAISNGGTGVVSAACASLIFLNPMFIGNAIFAFDSATMGVSILISIASAYVFSKLKYLDVAWKSIAITCVMSIYQPSSALFVTMTALVVIIKITNKDKEYLYGLIINAISFILGFIIYNQVVQRFYPPNEYAKRNAQFIDFHNGFISGITDAFSRNLEPIMGSMPDIVKLSVGVTLFISIAYILKLSLSKEIRATERLLLAGSFVFSLIMFSGFSLAVKSDYVMPRVLMSLGLTLTLIFFVAYKVKAFKFIICSAFVILIINSINISYSFNNAVKHQNRFDTQLLTSVSSAIHQNGIKRIDNINMVGWPPVSMPTKVAFSKYPFFKSIIPQYLSSSWGIGAVAPYYDLFIKNRHYNNQEMKADIIKRGDKIFTSCSIDVYKAESDILFDFSNKC
ncbi:hypothetical protein EYY83_11560 [Hafnia alvei]|uniref:glucosyltransferase domain-containing protein n=1 Tax=Hafnia alvei TaxID=569 RepID=UPI0010352ECC|nr:glucosyltransferase domain-containing protein [Hafnia alvei]TBM14785.1 hypothetical protein EYY83_11560 [Hafnia alvei]